MPSLSGPNTTAVALCNGIFIGIWGDHLTAASIAGANGIWAVTNYLGGVLRHSQFWISFGPKWERWLISPAMHHIHHSANPKHFDKNMGGALSIWDRWFGTIYYADEEAVKTFGIGPETEEFRSIKALYFRPFANAFKRFQPETKQTNEPKAA